MKIRMFIFQERLRATIRDFDERFRKRPRRGQRFLVRIIRVNNKSSLKFR